MRADFTKNQTFIIEMLQLGNTQKEIAEIQSRSPRTIQKNVGDMLNKHNARNTTHLVHIYHQKKGLLN